MSLKDLPEVTALNVSSDLFEFLPAENSVEAFNGNIRSAVNGENSISLFGEIGPSFFSEVENTDKRVAGALRAIGKKDITVDINSLGGNFFHGLAIYNLLRAHPAKVTVNVLGMAGSIASVIAMAGDEVNVADGSLIMVHNSSGVIRGNKHELEDIREVLGEIDRSMATIYSARAEVDEKTAMAWMDKRRGAGTTFSAASAIDNGLADQKLDRDAIEITAEIEHKDIPPERFIEHALMAEGNTRNQARGIIARVKGGKPDAAIDVMPDAGDLTAALLQLRSTLTN